MWVNKLAKPSLQVRVAVSSSIFKCSEFKTTKLNGEKHSFLHCICNRSIDMHPKLCMKNRFSVTSLAFNAIKFATTKLHHRAMYLKTSCLPH